MSRTPRPTSSLSLLTCPPRGNKTKAPPTGSRKRTSPTGAATCSNRPRWCQMSAMPPDAAAIAAPDLAPVLDAHRGEEALRAAVEAACAPASPPGVLLSLLGRFIQFNSAFGAGLANLAGEIAARQSLFQDRDEPVRILADRASEVAADFFYAAVDEFDDRLTPWRDTHRTLAQATLKGLGAHFGYEPAALNDVVRISRATSVACAAVWDGYGVGARLDDRQLFCAMGFHAGSEVLADHEFTVIDRCLRARRADLVKALEETAVEVLGHRHNAYYWIRIHTSVETEHFEAALKGVNNALRFYAGAEGPTTVKGWILDGFRRFAQVQGDFMERLGDD